MTDQHDLSLAPGCYGMGLTFQAESAECRSCPFAVRCGEASANMLADLRAELGITTPAPPKTRPKREVSGDDLTSTLPVKVQALMERIERAGIRVTEALARGENPIPEKGIPFLRVAFHLLLRLQGNTIHRDLLQSAFQKKLNWAPSTAAAHVVQTIQVLAALGAAEEHNGTITLKRNP